MLPSFLFAAALLADSGPRFVITKFAWQSTSGICSTQSQRATVEGLPADVKARIDAILDKMLVAESGLNDAGVTQRMAACTKFSAEYTGITPPAKILVQSDWKQGLAKGRWLSVRLHTMMSVEPSAHPSDDYVSVTFDLTHGGYPVPTSGFYPSRRRASFNEALHAADRVQFLEAAHLSGNDTPDPNELARKDAALNVESSQMLLTPTGIEVTDTVGAEVARNFILTIAYSALNAVGTPGGPLDPSTR